jgi:hypothetical protein
VKISTSHAVGYVTVAAMVPYLSIKTAWLLGSDVGVVDRGLMRTTPFVVGNLITAAMEIAGAALALALVHQWGRRLPAWLVLFPLWVATGLLAPVMLAAPLGFLVGTNAAPAAGGPVDGLEGWVYGVVYAGFILQGIGLGVAFVLHVRARWGHVFRGQIGARVAIDDDARPDATALPGASRVRSTAVLVALVLVVVAVRLFWAFGGPTGLASEEPNGRSAAQRALDASTASLALAGLIGVVILVARQPIRAWLPLAAAWLGTGAMFCSGGYQLTLLLAPNTPFDTTGAGWFGLLIAIQAIAGLLGASTLRGALISPSHVPAPRHAEPVA